MMLSTEKIKEVSLQDENHFDFLSGLWTGKKPPFIKAVVIRNTNFSNNGLVDYSDIAILDVELKQLEKRKLQKGDIIVERSGGGPKQPVGRVVYFDKDTTSVDYSFSNFTSVIRVKDKSVFDPKFIFYFLYNFYQEGKTDQLQRRTTGIRNLDFQSYKESIIFPPISVEEQSKIAQDLSAIQDAIAGQEELIAKLKDLKKSMMQHLFTHGVKGEKTKMTEIGEVPESWEVVDFESSLQRIKIGKSKQIPLKQYNAGVKFPIIDQSQNDIAGHTDKEEKVIFDSLPYIIFGDHTRIFKYVDFPFSLGADGTKVIKPKIDFNVKFFFYQMLNLKIDSRGYNRHYTILKEKKIVKPKIEEQEGIANILDSVEIKIKISEEKLSNYQNLFKTLLHELMSGERRMS